MFPLSVILLICSHQASFTGSQHRSRIIVTVLPKLKGPAQVCVLLLWLDVIYIHKHINMHTYIYTHTHVHKHFYTERVVVLLLFVNYCDSDDSVTVVAVVFS